MKKIFLLSTLFVALGISAQQNQQERPAPPTVEQQMGQFDDLGLSSKQKKKLKTLFEERQQNFQNNPGQGPNNGNSNAPKDQQFGSYDHKQLSSPRNESQNREKKGNNEFDAKIKKILTTEQYAKFQQKQKQGHENGDKNREGKKNFQKSDANKGGY